MKFNQREIIEIKEISASLNVIMDFKIDKDGSIDYDFSNNTTIFSIIRKTEEGFKFYGVNSNGIDFSYGNADFNQIKYHIRNFVKSIKRDNPYEIERKNNIKKISPNFYNIFQEASIISGIGFKESSGMIYRKALEIIVKDFLRHQFPDSYEDFINKNTIGTIIFSFYDKKENALIIREKEKYKDIASELNELKHLTKIISNTFKIGNDFSHYERRLAEFTDENMKVNILKIVEYINLRIEDKKNEFKKAELNTNFSSDDLIK